MSIDMDQEMTLGETATGKPEIVVARGIDYDSFVSHAQAFVDRFGLSVTRKINGPGERMWLATLGDHELCVSWDDWYYDITVMAWGDTPDEVIRDLFSRV
jgi:hypothetical protein